MTHVAQCFVDMPFGKKTDARRGMEIDFDQIYEEAIKPVIQAVGLEPLRGDEERTGGVIHAAMFARLLFAEYVIADLTLANPNVFYELGIRHAAKPYTTVPIFAGSDPLPFDVAMIRAVPYRLEDGRLTVEEAAKLKAGLEARLKEAIHGPSTHDSPLFQLIPDFPQIDLSHEVTEAFQARVRHEEAFREKLDQAIAKSSNAERRNALLQVQRELGDLKTIQRSVIVDLMLSYRAVEAFDEMVALIEASHDVVRDLILVRQQWAFALNRRNQPGDRDKAADILEKLIHQRGADPETLGLLGRVHKDRYKDFKKAGSIMAYAALDDAINAYRKGFESDPRDYYPGINAITLLVDKGDEESLKQAEQLLPLVSFAVARRGGATSSDYWDRATVLELACIGGDWVGATRVLPRVLAAAKESWIPKTTWDNLELLKKARSQRGLAVPQLDEIMEYLSRRGEELRGEEDAGK